MSDEQTRSDLMATQCAFEQLDTRYRRSTSTWAGGQHDVLVYFVDPADSFHGTIGAKGGTVTAWSKNRKWKGSNSVHKFTVPPDWRYRIADDDLAEIDGAICLEAIPLDGAPIEAEAWKVCLVRQSRGVDLKTESTIAVRFAGRMAVGKTMAAAKRKIAKGLVEALAY